MVEDAGAGTNPVARMRPRGGWRRRRCGLCPFRRGMFTAKGMPGGCVREKQNRGAAGAPRSGGRGGRGYFLREGLEGGVAAGASWVLGWMASITGVAMKTEA